METALNTSNLLTTTNVNKVTWHNTNLSNGLEKIVSELHIPGLCISKDFFKFGSLPGEFVYWDHKTGEVRKIEIRKVIYSGPATIVIWSDNTKTVSTCRNNDVYDREKGLMCCIVKKLYRSESLEDLLESWTMSRKEQKFDTYTIILKDVRKKHKKLKKASF